MPGRVPSTRRRKSACGEGILIRIGDLRVERPDAELAGDLPALRLVAAAEAVAAVEVGANGGLSSTCAVSEATLAASCTGILCTRDALNRQQWASEPCESVADLATTSPSCNDTVDEILGAASIRFPSISLLFGVMRRLALATWHPHGKQAHKAPHKCILLYYN